MINGKPDYSQLAQTQPYNGAVFRALLLSTLFGSAAIAQTAHFGNSVVQINVSGGQEKFWTLASSADHSYSFTAPVFELDGIPVSAEFTGAPSIAKHSVTKDITEYTVAGKLSKRAGASVDLIFRIAQTSPVVRFRYVLHFSAPTPLTRVQGRDDLQYLSTSFASLPRVTEVHLSEFNQLIHSYTAAERTVNQTLFADRQLCMGPILVGEDVSGNTLLVAYEHGSTTPDAFVQFQLSPERKVSMQAVKGNYVPGEPLTTYETIWMDASATSGGLDGAASVFRTHLLRFVNASDASRQPYIFYNTWNFQERNKWRNGKPYLESMNLGRILQEIDAAHQMGIEVFVMDTGWYEKTGDWKVSTSRFPEGLRPIRERLDKYGMKLGLWFNPTAAAISSNMYLGHKDSVQTRNGKVPEPRPIWETEASYPMCLVSSYADAFSDELIRIARDYGVRYFKWDAIGQYGCDSAAHGHGTQANTSAERADSYAFQLPLAMTRVVEKLTAAYPDAIVDFDVTESGRAFGLGFLSAGKYFLINNGPYLFNYDLPIDRANQNWNLFFNPGPARTWICRMPLNYDRWIPSVLLLTHYFPDDPVSSQTVNLASLVLGQNGIWGDLPAVSKEGVALISRVLGKYKQVRDDMARAFPSVSGAVAGTPEIHEKIDEQTGRGAVVIFSTAPNTYRVLTQHTPVHTWWATENTRVEFDSSGHAIIQADTKQGAAIVFFGAN